MKQALLITAYKNPVHLNNLIDVFDDNFPIYIHIDSKGTFTDEDIRNLRSKPNVKFVSRDYKVQWGSINHLKAILQLCREAAKDISIEYVHTITGHDYPIQSPAEITRFMEENRGTVFMEVNKLPYHAWYKGGLDRLMYYHPHDLINVRTERNYKLKERLIKLQQKFRINRSFPKSFPKDLYGGLVYWSIPTDAMKYILDFSDNNPSFLRRFRFTYCSEEIFFQTIIMNSLYKDRVKSNNLRFVIWQERNGNNPANLDETDYENILKSDALFARKFEFPVSQKLYEILKEKISNK